MANRPTIPTEFRTRETADLFLVLLMKILKPGGRAGLVLPDGTLFGEGVKTRIKEALLAECNLHTIVRLPNGVFSPYTGIRTNLLFFTKGQPTTEIWYYEHPYPPSAKSYNKTTPIRVEEFEPSRAWWENRVENEQAWRVPIAQIKAGNYVTAPPQKTANKRCNCNRLALTALHAVALRAALLGGRS